MNGLLSESQLAHLDRVYLTMLSSCCWSSRVSYKQTRPNHCPITLKYHREAAYCFNKGMVFCKSSPSDLEITLLLFHPHVSGKIKSTFVPMKALDVLTIHLNLSLQISFPRFAMPLQILPSLSLHDPMH